MFRIWVDGRLKSLEELYNEAIQQDNPPKYVKILKELIELERLENKENN